MFVLQKKKHSIFKRGNNGTLNGMITPKYVKEQVEHMT